MQQGCPLGASSRKVEINSRPDRHLTLPGFARPKDNYQCQELMRFRKSRDGHGTNAMCLGQDEVGIAPLVCFVIVLVAG